MRANMPRTSDRHVNEKPFRIALNLRESAPFYPLDLQKIAKEEALEKAKAAVAELNALGLNYTLTAGKPAKAGSAKEKRTIKAAACPICEFQTSPPHDGRTHRNQKRKGPFSAAELNEKGLVKV